jgi:hypothetical protein
MRIVFTLVVGTLLSAVAVPAGAQQSWGGAGPYARPMAYGQQPYAQPYGQMAYGQQPYAQPSSLGAYYAQAGSPYYPPNNQPMPMQYPGGYAPGYRQAGYRMQPMATQQPTPAAEPSPAEAVEGQVVDENGQPYAGEDGSYPAEGYDPNGDYFEQGYSDGSYDGSVGDYVGPAGSPGPAVGVRPASIFTWQAPPTGTRFGALAGPPYAALRAIDGDDPMGVIAGFNTIRSRIGQPYFKADALMLRRSNPQGNVTILENLNTGFTELGSGDLRFKNELGYRLIAGMSFNERQAFEVSYFAVQNFNVTNAVLAPGLVSLPPPLSLAGSIHALQFADSANISYGTQIWNAEGNFLQTTVFENWSVLGGFREFQLQDGMELFIQHPSFASDGYLNQFTRNRLTGGQIGLRYQRNIDLLTIEVNGKAGAYDNFAQQSNLINDQGVIRAGYAQTHNSSFIGDVNINAIYHFGNFLALRVGYNFLAVTRVAMAPNQLDFSDIQGVSGFQLNHSQNVYFYGLNVGLEARF